jgi:hypothetical protein
MPSSKPFRPSCRAALAAALAALALAAFAAPTGAAAAPQFHRGGLPAIGGVTLRETPSGRVAISAPVTYRQALSGSPRGLETSRVTVHIAAKLKRGRATGTAFERSRRYRLHGTETVVARFTLGPKASRWLLRRSRKVRGRLVRLDAEHLVKQRRGERPLYEKAASVTMASSHRARPQGASGILTLRNATAEPVESVATPVMCMYTNGEWGSNLQAFSTDGEPIQPGGTIEAEIEADGSVLSDAEYEGETSPFGVDELGIAAEVIGNALDVELGPFVALVDLATHCDAMASTFSIVVADAKGTAASSEAWVLTDENCRYGCPRDHFISAYEALGYQSPGEENGSEIWASASTELLEGFAGYYYAAAPAKGRVVQDNGLRFDWSEGSDDQWEATVSAGSSPAGFSG